MVRLTDEDLQFLAVFARRPEWQIISALIDRWESDAVNELRNATGEQTVKLQGKLIAIGEFRGFVTGAAQKIKRSEVPMRRTTSTAP